MDAVSVMGNSPESGIPDNESYKADALAIPIDFT
jgi:hypothetical protein